MQQYISSSTCSLMAVCLLCSRLIFSAHAAESAALAPDPLYEGKPLSHWVLGDTNSALCFAPIRAGPYGYLDRYSREAVKSIGTNAIPFLLQLMESYPYRAAEALGVLGTNAHSAIPGLARFATNQAPPRADSQTRVQIESARKAAVSTLGRIDPEALPVLCAVATNRIFGRDVRTTALSGITSMGTNASASAAALLQCLKDEDKHVVVSALLALEHVPTNDQEILLGILDCLDSPDPMLRRYAVSALAPFGECVLPVLGRAVEDDDRIVRVRALRALASLGKRALPAITWGLKDDDPSVRGSALEALVQAAPSALTNTSVLALGAEGLRSSGERREWAAQLLRAAGQQAAGGQPDLQVRLPDGWDRVFQEATSALRRLAPELLQTGVSPQQ
jgi:HEAT repeat protein